MRAEPLVSILINNYNYGHVLGDAIDSALAQTYPRVEVVVVDDGSTDDSRRVIESYGSRIVPVLQANGGQCAAVSAGFTASRGEILCLLDSDDVFFPTKVARVVEVFEEHAEVAWMKHALQVADGRLRPVGGLTPPIAKSRVLRPRPSAALEDKTRFVVSSGVSVRRSTAERYLPIPPEHLAEWRFCADAYVGFWSSVYGASYELAEPLGYYRREDYQRVLTDDDLVLWLERQNTLETRFARMWSEHTGRAVLGSDVRKHHLIIDTLRGAPLLAGARRRELLAGLVDLSRITRAEPVLAARQAVGLLVAFGAPRAWIARLCRVLGVEHATGGPPAKSGERPAVPVNSLHHFT